MQTAISHFPLRAALLAALLAGAAEAEAQVGYVSVDKTRVYIQSSATAVALKPAPVPCNSNCPYAFSARVGGTGIGGIPAPTLGGPIDSASLGAFWNGGALGFNAGNNEWELGYPPVGEWNSPTQADLDAKFANGTYTLTVQGVAYTINLTSDAYPAPPVVDVAGTGSWTGGKFVFDPRAPLTLSVPTTSFGALGGLVGLYGCLQSGGFGCPYHAGSGSSPASIALPANTFPDGAEVAFVATYSNGVDRGAGQNGAPQSYAWYNARTHVAVKAQLPQVFPLTVNSNITPTVASATASFQPRPQDVGQSASVYVFAVAPSTSVVNPAASKSARLAVRAEGAPADTPVQCVLAQLNSSGQLQAVSAANLQAYVTGVLSSQGQAVTILNGVPTVNIGGATFYVGYGSTASAMINSGVNQRALSVAGSIQCDPKPPKTGWWWNTAEGGRGYSIEITGNRIFFGSYLYDASGRATWYVASGTTSLDGSLFTGNLEAYTRGQTLAGQYRAPGAAVNAGALTLAFADASHGTMIWPGGSVAIERFDIVRNGSTLDPGANQPEAGWWWNPEESGRGFFLEWQGGQLFMTGFMFDDAGNPIWYLSQDTSPATNPRSYSGVWWQYGNGQTLMGPYRAPTRVNDNVAPVTIQFSGPETGIMTLPNGRTTAIRRFRF